MHCFEVGRNFRAYVDHVCFNGRIVGSDIPDIIDIPENNAGHEECTNRAKDEETANRPPRFRMTRARTPDLGVHGGPSPVCGFLLGGGEVEREKPPSLSTGGVKISAL